MLPVGFSEAIGSSRTQLVQTGQTAFPELLYLEKCLGDLAYIENPSPRQDGPIQLLSAANDDAYYPRTEKKTFQS
jgi:hypothetical protein